MTIHHDKLAYGRLASMKEESSEQKLAAMAKKLSAEPDGEREKQPDSKDGEEEE